MSESIADSSLLQPIEGTSITVLRLDQRDATGSGNKAFKLTYNIDAAKAAGLSRLISFGGVWSNHIHALALAGRQHQMQTIGLIRGEPGEPLNAMLSDAEAAGMQLHFLSRSDYRRRQDPDFLAELSREFPLCYWIPEGAANLEGVRGCMDIGRLLPADADIVVLPCGTAATLAGVAAACPNKQVIGISVLRGAVDLPCRVRAYLDELYCAGHIDTVPDNWTIMQDYHCGGYARVNRELVEFIAHFQQRTGIATEPVYSAKMFFALRHLLASGQIAGDARVAAIHTGGMQGLRGMQETLRRFSTSQTERCCA